MSWKKPLLQTDRETEEIDFINSRQIKLLSQDWTVKKWTVKKKKKNMHMTEMPVHVFDHELFFFCYSTTHF